jgi:hypothetical protein
LGECTSSCFNDSHCMSLIGIPREHTGRDRACKVRNHRIPAVSGHFLDAPAAATPHSARTTVKVGSSLASRRTCALSARSRLAIPWGLASAAVRSFCAAAAVAIDHEHDEAGLYRCRGFRWASSVAAARKEWPRSAARLRYDPKTFIPTPEKPHKAQPRQHVPYLRIGRAAPSSDRPAEPVFTD